MSELPELPEPDDDPDHTFTAILRQRWPVGAWMRKNFSLPAVVTILSIIAGAGSYIINLKTRVVVLETKVIPFVADQGQLGVINARLDGHDREIAELEDDWRTAYQHAGDAPAAAAAPRRGRQAHGR